MVCKFLIFQANKSNIYNSSLDLFKLVLLGVLKCLKTGWLTEQRIRKLIKIQQYENDNVLTFLLIISVKIGSHKRIFEQKVWKFGKSDRCYKSFK